MLVTALAAVLVPLWTIRRGRVQTAEARAARDYLENVLNAMPHGAMTSSLTGQIRGVNDTLCALVGKPKDTLVGTPCADLFADDIGFLQPQKSPDGGPAAASRYESALITTRGERIPVAVSWARVHNSAVTDEVPAEAIMLMVQDLSEQRRAEEALQAAAEAAEAADRSKGEFLAHMSHEIRTPMSGVLGAAKLLRDSDLPAQQRKWVDIINDSAEALLTIINDILDFSKISAGMLSFDQVEFDIADTMEAMRPLFRELIAKKSLSLAIVITPGLPSRLRGDPGRLRQVLINLVSNAIKFTDAGEIWVEARIERDTEAALTVRFAVQDSGSGIDSELVPRLFEPFTQATGQRHSGTGLGLAICKQLVERMNGDIGVNTELGVGSTFWFTAEFDKVPPDARQLADAAPALAADQPASAAADDGRDQSGDSADSSADARGDDAGNNNADADNADRADARDADNADSANFDDSADDSRPSRILVVEDNAVNQQVILQLLRKRGYAAEAVANGLEALDAVAEERYSAVLMDCQMPEMDGYQATAEIRRREAASGDPRMPIIAMTAHAMQGDREKCLAAGMDDYLSKPVELAVLDRLLRAHVRDPAAAPAPALAPALAPAADRTRPAAQPHGGADPRPTAAAASPARPASAPESALEAIKRSNPAAFREIIDIYLDETSKCLVDLTAAVDARESENVRVLAHGCRGASANCGMSEMVAVMSELEAIANDPALPGADALLARARGELERARETLRTQQRALTPPS